MRSAIVRLVLSAVIIAGVGTADLMGTPAATDVLPRELTALERRYRKATTLEATFLERYSENGVQVRVESGTAYFRKPGKMRWEYKEPEKSTFLVDGKYVWFYAPADHTATRMPAKKSEDWRTPIAFLTTGMKLSRICSGVEPANDLKPSQAANIVYRCVLRAADGKPGTQPETVLFETTPGNELARIVVPQQDGTQIEFEFKNWEWDPPLSKDMFAFEPPPDTVIVNGVLPEAPGMRQ